MSIAKHYDGCACTACTRQATLNEVRQEVNSYLEACAAFVDEVEPDRILAIIDAMKEEE